MLSVTTRINTISQPIGGYVPKNLFKVVNFHDEYKIIGVKATFSSIQGLATDYMTRFMLSNNKYSAFHISILGAKTLDEVYENDNEYKYIMSLLDDVKGLDDSSIYKACQIVGYDSAFRAGVESYRDIRDIIPPPELISNIKILVNRCLSFLKTLEPLVSDGFTFDGGYTALVSSGDGDYLTSDTLIDFKVSKESFISKWSLQLLMYYLMGIHSIYPEFKYIKYLCFFNPLKNISYTVDILDIDDKIKYIVSHNVIGYKMTYDCVQLDSYGNEYYDYSTWQDVEGSDLDILYEFLNRNMNTDFDINNYKDGIHSISIRDYWTYMRSIDFQYTNSLCPLFKDIECIIMIKHNGYTMFFSLSYAGVLCILHGATRKKASFELEYYYNNIDKYCSCVLVAFNKYWSALSNISFQLQSLKPNKDMLRKYNYSKYIRKQKLSDEPILKFDDWYEKYGKNIRLSGNIHGCIVDIDYYNHIYLNPYDSKLTAYYAISMYDKDVYKNTLSLITEQRPEMLESFKDLLNNDSNELLDISKKENYELISITDVASKETTKVYDYSMYSISKKLKPLQNILTNSLVQVWYDDILIDNTIFLENLFSSALEKNN